MVSPFALLLSFLLFPYQCESYTEVFSIAKDSNDNTYLVGNRDANFFIGKKSAPCVLQWESTAGSTSGDNDNDVKDEVLYDVIIGQDDIVYAVGSTKGNFSSPLDKVPNLDAAVLVYDPGNGDVVIQRQYDIAADLDNVAQAITQKADGNLLIAVHGSVSNIETSVTYQTRILDIDSQTLDVQRIHEIEITTTEGLLSLTGGPKLQDFVYEASSDSIIAVGHILGRGILWKYNLATNTTAGQTEWGEVLGNFQISGFTTDGNGAYFIVGSSSERVLGNDDLLSTVSTEFHAYVIRYDNLESSPSSATWIRQLAGAGSSQSGRGIAIDPVTGDIVVVGDFDSDFTVTDGQTSESFTVGSVADNGITDVFLWILDAATGDFKDLRLSSVASTASEDRGNTVSVLSSRTIHIGGITDDGNDAGATVCDTTNVLRSPSPSFSSTASSTPSSTATAVAFASERFLPSALTAPTASMTASPSIVSLFSETPRVISQVQSFSSIPTTSSAPSMAVTTISASPVRSLDAILPSSFEATVPSILLHSNPYFGTFEILSTPVEPPNDIFEVTPSSSAELAIGYEVPLTSNDSSVMMGTAEVQLEEAANASNLYIEVSQSPAVTAIETEASRSIDEASPSEGHDVSEFPRLAIFSNGFAPIENAIPSFTLRPFPTAFVFSPILPTSSQDIERDGEITLASLTTPVEAMSNLIPSISVSFILVDLGTATPSPSTPTLIPSANFSFTLVDLGTATPSSSASPLELVPSMSPENPSFAFGFPFVSDEGMTTVEADDKRRLASTYMLVPSDISGGNDIDMLLATPGASGPHFVETPEKIILAFEATIEPSSVLLDPFATTNDIIQESNSTSDPLESSYDGSGVIPSARESQDLFSMYPLESLVLQTPSFFQETEFPRRIESSMSTGADAISGPAFNERFTPEEMSREPNEKHPFYFIPSPDSRTPAPDMLVSPEPSHGPMVLGVIPPFPSLNAQGAMPLLIPSESLATTEQEPSAGALNASKDFVYASYSPIARESTSTDTSLSETPSISLPLQKTSADTTSPPLSLEQSGEATYLVQPSQQSMLLPSDTYGEKNLRENFATETLIDEEVMLKAAPSALQTLEQNPNEDYPILQSYEPEGTHLPGLGSSTVTSSAAFSNDFDGKETTPQPSLYSKGRQSPSSSIHNSNESQTPKPLAELLPRTSLALEDGKEDPDNLMTSSDETDISHPADAIETGSPSSSEEDPSQTKAASSSPFQTAVTSSSVGPQPSETARVIPTTFSMPSQTFELSGPTFGVSELQDESFSFSPQSNEADPKQPLPTLFKDVGDGSAFPSEELSLTPPETAFGGMIEQSVEYIAISTSVILPSLSVSPPALDFNKEHFTIEPRDGTDAEIGTTSENLFLIPSITASPFVVFGSPTGSPGEIEERPGFTFPFTNLPFSTPATSEHLNEDSTNLNLSGSQLVKSTPLTAESALVSMSAPPTFNTPKASESALSSTLIPSGLQEGSREPLISFIDIVLASATPSSSPRSNQGILSATPAISAATVSQMVSGLPTTVAPLVSKESIPASPSVRSVTITPNHSARSGPSDTVSIVLPSATPSLSSALASNTHKPSSTTFDAPRSASPTLASMSTFSPAPGDTSNLLSPSIAPSTSVQLNTPAASPSSAKRELSSSFFSQVAASPAPIMSPSPSMSRGTNFSKSATVSAPPSTSILTSSRTSSPTSPTSLPLLSSQPSSLATSTSTLTITPGASPMLTSSFLPSICPKPSSLETPKFQPSISSQPSSLATSTSVSALSPQPSPLVSKFFLPSFSPGPTSLEPSTSLPSSSSESPSLGTSTPVSTITPRPTTLVTELVIPSISPGLTSLETLEFLPPISSESPSLETPTYLSSTSSVSEEAGASASLLISPYTSEEVDLSTSVSVIPSSFGEFDPSMPPLVSPSISEDVAPSKFPSMIPVPSRIELPTPEATSFSTPASSSSSRSTTSPTAECLSIGSVLTDESTLNKTRNFQRINMVIQVAGPNLTSSCQFTAIVAERFIFLSAINTLSQADMWHITSVEDGPPVFEEGSSLVIIEQEDNTESEIARASPTRSNDSGKRVRFAGSAIFNVTAFMDSLSIALASGPYVEYIDSQNIVKVMTAEGFEDIKWTGMVVGPVIVDGRTFEKETRTGRGSLSSGEISALAMGGLLIVGVAIFVIVEGGVSTRRPGPMLPI